MQPRAKRWIKYFKMEWPLHVMLLPPVVLIIIYNYIPMYGTILAFEKYLPSAMFASPWVGFDNFRKLFSMPGFLDVIRNTLAIAGGKIILGIAVPVIVSVMLNELRNVHVKRTVQTIIYMPYFVSWVLMAAIIIRMLSQFGIVNYVLLSLGIIKEPILYLLKPDLFPGLMIATETWKSFGYGTVIYLATLAGINPDLYEAASIDGAGRWRQTWHVTLPGLVPIVALISCLNLSGIFNAGFDQIFNLYNPNVYSTGDIIDTYLYRMAFKSNQISISTAAGLFKSAISFVLIAVSYRVAYKISGYRVI